VDILILHRVFNRRIPLLKFFIKQELFWVPVLGQIWWLLDFPFMKRYSRAFLEKNPHLKGRDLEITKRACRKFREIPISVMSFVEGTRFSLEKHLKQGSPFVHLLKPRGGGAAMVLSTMGEQIHNIIDVTIAYPHGMKSFWAFLCGKVKEVRVKVETLPIGELVCGEYLRDHDCRRCVQEWLNERWQLKDQTMASFCLPDSPPPCGYIQ
jgi:1-acyl-sn-glycerol-3-phosphate acyltransferase